MEAIVISGSAGDGTGTPVLVLPSNVVALGLGSRGRHEWLGMRTPLLQRLWGTLKKEQLCHLMHGDHPTSTMS